jgi:hypothetical protein
MGIKDKQLTTAKNKDLSENSAKTTFVFVFQAKNLRGGDAVEGVALVREIGVEVRPELDKEEGVPGSLLVELLQPAGLLRELVLDLPHVHRLQTSSTRQLK